MIENGSYCVDILTQVRAARGALKSIELAILETHMKSCLDEASHEKKDKKIQEIMTLLKKYE